MKSLVEHLSFLKTEKIKNQENPNYEHLIAILCNVYRLARDLDEQGINRVS